MNKILNRLSVPKRREVCRKYFDRDGGKVYSVRDLAKEYGVTEHVIRNILAGRVKLSRSPRSDKGMRRMAPRDLAGVNPLELMDAGWDMKDHLQYQARKALEDLQTKRINIIERVKILDVLARIQRQLKEQEIEAHIKRADAQVIARIIRRYLPAATDSDIIKIFREELERWKHAQ